MIGPFTTEAVLADGYAAGLLATAAGLDRLARHVAERPRDGREMVRALRPWPHSEAGCFHRGLTLVLVVLAASPALIQAVRHPAWPDLSLAATADVSGRRRRRPGPTGRGRGP
ncbi:hypothetical protein [Microbispora sp. NPDC046933]|uniref:hypothetical protein n=1 Tax=Microbispora sp. NPDC046933 TaxID=3155618 RepID=UPI0033D98AEB